ncbi:MAG: tyrosine-type recombinase/integrase [Deltaproteobacteria bacterium]|nr:tyrosine-type recombinase/integrase [Deltaproteobacteria bacterium]
MRVIAPRRCFLTWYETSEQRNLVPSDLTPIVLVGYRAALQQKQATSTVNVHVSALRAWCAWLTDQGYLKDNPAARLKLIRRDAPLAPRALANTEVNALLRATQRSRHKKRNYAIIQILLQTGMRIGECQALTAVRYLRTPSARQDITFGQKSGTVNIRAGKGNKARKVPLNGSARAALASYAAPLLGVSENTKAVAAVWPHRSGEALWRSQKGNQLSSVALWRVISGRFAYA